jgi:hypothetical protein
VKKSLAFAFVLLMTTACLHSSLSCVSQIPLPAQPGLEGGIGQSRQTAARTRWGDSGEVSGELARCYDSLAKLQPLQ